MNIKLIIAMMLIPYFSIADGSCGTPLVPHVDPANQREFQNVYQCISDVLSSTGTFSSIVISPNIATANTGSVGEYVSSLITAATDFPASGSFGDLTSISLTSGDWDVSAGLLNVVNGATETLVVMGISTTPGNDSAGLNDGDTNFKFGATLSSGQNSGVVSGVRLLLSSATTVYLKYEAAYSVATPRARGRLSARRIR